MLGLAWKFIKYDRAKSIGVVTAIVISIFLIGQQLGLMFYLMDLMGNLVGNAPTNDRQIWIIERQSNNVNAINLLDARYVNEIASLPGVETTHPVVLAPAQASFLDGKTAAVTLVGAQAPQFVMGPVSDRIDQGGWTNLLQPGAVSAEFYSAKNWKTTLFLHKPIEINGRSASIEVITKNAQAFGASLLYTTLENARLYGNISASKVSIIVADLKEGVDKEEVMQQVHTLYPSLRAWDPQDLRWTTTMEILVTSNMGMSFGTLVLFAMISGFFIIGLTLYSSALDRIKDYGTLKAIGAKNGFVNRLIIAQAFLFALMGYAIAMFLLYGFKMGVAKSGLIVDLNVGFLLFLLLVTLVISVGGSLFAVRRIAKLEPASVF
jgi:putative ABC transport system permease protein